MYLEQALGRCGSGIRGCHGPDRREEGDDDFLQQHSPVRPIRGRERERSVRSCNVHRCAGRRSCHDRSATTKMATYHSPNAMKRDPAWRKVVGHVHAGVSKDDVVKPDAPEYLKYARKRRRCIESGLEGWRDGRLTAYLRSASLPPLRYGRDVPPRKLRIGKWTMDDPSSGLGIFSVVEDDGPERFGISTEAEWLPNLFDYIHDVSSDQADMTSAPSLATTPPRPVIHCHAHPPLRRVSHVKVQWMRWRRIALRDSARH